MYLHAQITPRIFLKGVIFYVLELQRNFAYEKQRIWYGLYIGQAFEVYKINDLSVKDFCRAEIKLTIHKNNTLNALILRHIWLLDECVFVVLKGGMTIEEQIAA